MRCSLLPKTIVICILARNCETALRNNIPRVERLRKQFTSSDIIVFENDSIDDTKNILSDWAAISDNIYIKSQNFDTITLTEKTKSNPNPGSAISRIEKMASYRNQCLNWIDHNQKSPDYVIVIDIDLLDISVEGILTSIEDAPSDWGGLFANGYTDLKIFDKCVHSLYHDLYAYIDKMPSVKPYLTPAEMFKNSKRLTKLIKLNNYLPVVSAFGGVGVYKYEAIKGLRYTVEANECILMEAVCEHVPFNMNVVTRGYRNYICNKMKTYYGKSNRIMILRDLLPLFLFKVIGFLFTFKWLKA